MRLGVCKYIGLITDKNTDCFSNWRRGLKKIIFFFLVGQGSTPKRAQFKQKNQNTHTYTYTLIQIKSAFLLLVSFFSHCGDLQLRAVFFYCSLVSVFLPFRPKLQLLVFFFCFDTCHLLFFFFFSQRLKLQ